MQCSKKLYNTILRIWGYAYLLPKYLGATACRHDTGDVYRTQNYYNGLINVKKLFSFHLS